jgi:signal transduction histidine kinase
MFSAHPARMADRPRILIVDDELGVRESLRAILQGDCETLMAGSGEEALAILKEKPIDVMTLDLKMPGQGGMRVLARARELDPDVEVLIITGYGSFDTAVEGLRLQVFDYLAKPFDCDQVRTLVQKALARREDRRRLKNAPDQILASVSHSLRNPLNVIMGYSSILREEEKDQLTEEQRRALDQIQANSTSLFGYVETMLYLADLERGLHPMAVGAVDVDALVVRLGRELEPVATAKRLALDVAASGDLGITSDEHKVAILVRALFDNAVKFTESGSVAVRAEPTPAGVVVEVRDTGPGLPPEMVPDLEAELANTGAAPTSRLLGFGLRLAARLARVLGGTLGFRTGADGTTWRLTLPRGVGAAEAATRRATA